MNILIQAYPNQGWVGDRYMTEMHLLPNRRQLPPHSCGPTIGQTEYQEELDDAPYGTAPDMWNILRKSALQRPDDSACNRRPKLEADLILITDPSI